MHDLDDVWRDDRLIEALASGEPVDTTDPAVAPLRALTGLVDAAPIPDHDIRGLENIVMLDTGRTRRVAVRSLAVALTAVATLSTSGVAAVVTGDPFQPAKVVWHQIQERAGDRWGADPASDEDRLDSGSAVGGDTGEAESIGDTDGAETSAQPAVFETARQQGTDGPPRLQRVDLTRPSREGLKAEPAPAPNGAVAEADGSDDAQRAQPSSVRQDASAAEQRQAQQETQQEERASTSPPTDDGAATDGSAQQREDAQRSEEEQESQDTRRSDQPEEDEQEPTPDAPADDLDPGVVPDGTDEYPGDDYRSMRLPDQNAEDTEESEEDVEEGDGATATEPAPEEDTSSTEEPTAEQSEGDEPWANRDVEQRAGSADETPAPARLDR